MNKIFTMPRYAVMYLITILILVGCNNEYERVFNESADERVKKVIDEYQNTLTSSPNGYKAIIYTGTGGGYMFYLDFNENGTVTMVSDFSQATAVTPMSATFAIKALQRPTLSFDTYSYIHLLADPDGSVNGGENGVGLMSDVEFAFEEFNGDSIDVTGIQRNTSMLLVQATQQEASEFLSGKLGDNIVNTTNFIAANPYPYFDFGGGTLIAVDVDPESKTVTIFHLGSDNTVSQTTLPFAFSTKGILLKDVVQFGNIGFQELTWDDAQQSFYVTQGNQKIYLQSSSIPVIPLVYALGYIHTDIIMDPTVITNLPQEFMDIYNQAKDELVLVGGYNLILDGFIVTFTQTNEVVITYFIHNNSGNYQANYFYTRNISGNGLVTFTLTGQDANASVIITGLQALLNYFANNSFAFDYEVDGDDVLAKVTPQQMPAAYFFGLLE